MSISMASDVRKRHRFVEQDMPFFSIAVMRLYYVQKESENSRQVQINMSQLMKDESDSTVHQLSMQLDH